MQDFSRLGVRRGIDALGLERREPAQHAARHGGIAPQHLDRRDQPVAAECRRVPGDAGVRVAALRRRGHQHAEIGGRAAQHFVEQIVRRLDAGHAARLAAQVAMRRKQSAQERQRLVLDGLAAADQQKDRHRFMRPENQAIDRGGLGELVRSRIEGQRRAPPRIVEALVAQQNLVRVGDQAARCRAAPCAALAADLEQIGEIIVEAQRERDLDRLEAVVAHRDALIGRAAPQEDRARDMDDVLLQHDVLAGVDIGIGEIDREQGVVVAHIGAEQQRLHVVQPQLEVRKKARIGVEQSVRAARGRADVPMAVDHDESVAVLQGAPRARRRGCCRDVVWNLCRNPEMRCVEAWSRDGGHRITLINRRRGIERS